jgi:hypothetical protein
MKITIAALIVVATITAGGCKTMLFGSYDYEDVDEARAQDQINMEDSTMVFFATYPNPYMDKEFMWFAVFITGEVEMYVHDLETDTVLSVYRFAAQTPPVHTIAIHEDRTHLVKCLLYVDGRMKCAKVYPAWTPIQFPQFETQYTISDN